VRPVDAKPMLALAVLLVAGCADGGQATCADAPASYAAVETRHTSSIMPLDPRQPQDLLAVTWGWPHPLEAASPWNGTPGFQRQATTDLYANGTGGLLVARFDAFDGAAGSEVRFGPAWVFESPYSASCSLALPLQKGIETTLEEGDLAQVGQGVRVLTAGFWENGTLFYTNMQDIHDSDVPRAGWYEWGGADPLNVYVYDQDRTERPAEWGPPTAQLASRPSLGPPFDDAAATGIGTAAGAEATAGVGYGTTIKGFNEALKGLSTTTSRVVWVAPEDAYTRAGNEDHVLYGDAVVFLIRVVEVVPAPCPGTLPCGAPDTLR
jgi:hypothetical protein